jgi:Domain of unknown function (DUF4917)
MAITPVSFDAAMKLVEGKGNIHLLLGNGFSIALKPDIFSYGSLFANADFSAEPEIKQLFEALETQDFEIAIRHLNDATRVVSVYQPDKNELLDKFRRHAGVIKAALVSAIARRHPDRPHKISEKQYAACRAFLNRFDHIFTLNYDVLLYWTLMQSEVDNLDLKADDGFRHPDNGQDLPYVSWQSGHTAKVCYLHGALHLFDQGTEIIKYTWSKTDVPIVDQVRSALDDDKYPLFVAEGTSASKVERILHNAYLAKALRSFEGCCGNSKNTIVIFGHSLAENDMHVLRHIAAGGCANLVVGLYGDPQSPANRAIVAKAEGLAEYRKRKRVRFPLKVTYYQADSAKVWG